MKTGESWLIRSIDVYDDVYYLFIKFTRSLSHSPAKRTHRSGGGKGGGWMMAEYKRQAEALVAGSHEAGPSAACELILPPPRESKLASPPCYHLDVC